MTTAARCVCLLFLLAVAALPAVAAAQATLPLRIAVRDAAGPLAAAVVVVNGTRHETGTGGTVTVTVTAGIVTIAASRLGFAPLTRTIAIGTAGPAEIVLTLEPFTVEDAVTVSATRTGRRLEDQATRVDVIGREEIEEKLLMTPGDIVMMLNEMGGLRVQATSPSLGAASVRVQGLSGRYTRFFSDGLPLFGDAGGLGLLQIPPMDLGQVEVIKGVASALYGAGAMGGVVNLISRRPGDDTEREVLLNRSTRGGTDAVLWYSTPAREGWAFTLLTGGHFQNRADVNGDGWADLAGYSRGVLRPRVFWEDGRGRTLFATGGVTVEDRAGGGTAGGAPYREALATTRVDAGLVAQAPIDDRSLLSVRAAVMHQRHDHEFGLVRERDRHGTVFGEVTLRRIAGRHILVGGLAFERQTYRPADLPRFAYTFNVPGLFVQDDVDVADWLTVSASARADHHSAYGAFFSPRVSSLLRAGAWTSRVSFGTGFFGPSPLTEETEAAGLSRLVVPEALEAERGRSITVDLGRTDGPVSYTATFFRSHVRDPIAVDRSNGLVLTNLNAPATATGAELLATLRHEPFSVTATYTFVRTRELDAGARLDAPLTPRHSAGLVAMWEREGSGRMGIEVYYTGAQRLEESPFRAWSRPYTIVGLLVERQIGRLRLFVNGENLTGVRQTNWDPLVRPSPAPDGRWTVDAWAPLEGRTVNGGARIRF